MMAVSFFCAGYFFMGIAVVGFATQTHNWLVITAAVVAWVLNIVVLRFANKRWK